MGHIEKSFCCPVCNSQLKKEDIPFKVDLNSNIFICPNGAVKLHKRDAELLYVLIASAPNFVETDRIYNLVWGKHCIENGSEDALRTCLKRIRKLLAPLNVKIINSYGYGFKIKMEEGHDE